MAYCVLVDGRMSPSRKRHPNRTNRRVGRSRADALATHPPFTGTRRTVLLDRCASIPRPINKN